MAALGQGLRGEAAKAAAGAGDENWGRFRGLVQAMRDQEINVPIVVRLAGTNVELGGPILEESGFPFIMADNLDDAATKVMATLEKQS